MKKLFCKIGVLASLSAILFFFFGLAYATIPALIALSGIALGLLSMRMFWENFIHLEMAERRRARRRASVPSVATARPFHAA